MEKRTGAGDASFVVMDGPVGNFGGKGGGKHRARLPNGQDFEFKASQIGAPAVFIFFIQFLTEPAFSFAFHLRAVPVLAKTGSDVFFIECIIHHHKTAAEVGRQHAGQKGDGNQIPHPGKDKYKERTA
jgi:hypothetical protein